MKTNNIARSMTRRGVNMPVVMKWEVTRKWIVVAEDYADALAKARDPVQAIYVEVVRG